MFGVDSFTGAKWLFCLGNAVLFLRVAFWLKAQSPRRTVVLLGSITALLVMAVAATAIEVGWVSGRERQKVTEREAEAARQEGEKTRVEARTGNLKGALRQQFLDFLKVPVGATYVRLPVRFSCSSRNEESCARAWQYLQLFSEAGWPLLISGGYIERNETLVPYSGVTLVSHTDRQSEQPPHSGTWQIMGESEQRIYGAFSQVGISVRSDSGPSVPKNTLIIHFAPDL
jgi:hypothetical protein